MTDHLPDPPGRRHRPGPHMTKLPIVLTLLCGDDKNGKPCDRPVGYLIEDGGEHYIVDADRFGGALPGPDPGEQIATVTNPPTVGDLADAVERGDRFLRILGTDHGRPA